MWLYNKSHNLDKCNENAKMALMRFIASSQLWPLMRQEEEQLFPVSVQ